MLTHRQTSRTAQTTAMRICAQCGEPLSSPDWSEPAGDRRIRHVWSCAACGCSFETQARFPAPFPTGTAGTAEPAHADDQAAASSR